MNDGKSTPAPVSLDGLTILIVEDETIIAFMIEDMLTELGCAAVLHAGRIQDALALLRDRKPDAVVLDVNLAGEHAYPVAMRLAEAQIPFIFTTGYGRSGLPAEWASRPVIQKPFSLEALADALRAAMPDRPAAR
jgi:CheY-like chemotaxis protein